MDEITVINVTSEPGRIAFSYFASLLVGTIFLVVMMQRYRLKYESWK